jgi:hypothetical protein
MWNILLLHFDRCALVGFVFCEAAIEIVNFDVVEIRYEQRVKDLKIDKESQNNKLISRKRCNSANQAPVCCRQLQPL